MSSLLVIKSAREKSYTYQHKHSFPAGMVPQEQIPKRMCEQIVEVPILVPPIMEEIAVVHLTTRERGQERIEEQSVGCPRASMEQITDVPYSRFMRSCPGEQAHVSAHQRT